MRSLVLFAGTGGSTEGMVRAGVTPDIAVDGWGTACGIHARWHDTIPVMCARIEHVHEAIPGPFDFIWASPSCKPWSTANRSHKRGHAHPEYYSLAHLVAQSFDRWSARVLVIENVCGLLWSREGKVECAELQAAAAARGLYATWTIVRSSDLGVMQLRQRPICVVARESIVLPQVMPLQRGSLAASVLTAQGGRNMVGGSHGGLKAEREARLHRSVSADEGRSGRPPFCTSNPSRAVVDASLPSRHRNWTERAARKTRSVLNPGGTQHDPRTREPNYHEGRSLAECAALQCLPMAPLEGLTKTAAHALVGNAVPPPLAEFVVREVLHAAGFEDGQRYGS